MAQGSAEVVARMYEAFSRGDAETALSYVDEEVITDPRHRIDGRLGKGHAEMVAILAEWLDTWDDWRQEVEEIHDLGDRVLVVDTQRGRGKGSGIEWEGHFGMLYEVRDEKITRWTIYDDLPAAFAAAGMAR